MLRLDVEPTNAASLAIALVVGLQTLADLGMELPLDALAPDVVRLLMPAFPAAVAGANAPKS